MIPRNKRIAPGWIALLLWLQKSEMRMRMRVGVISWIGWLAVGLAALIAILADNPPGKRPATSATPADQNPPQSKKMTDAVRVVGRIQSRAIQECSGVVASRKHPGVLWTHNDQGNEPNLYAIAPDGRLLAQYRVDVRNGDWEDIAIDNEGRLYIGDLGNNECLKTELKVHRVLEPDPATATLFSRNRLPAETTWRLRFPNKPFDCESLFIQGDHGYVIDKVPDGKHTRLYRFALNPPGGTQILEEVARLPVKHSATGADLSADGQRLAVVTKAGLYVFEVKGDPRRAAQIKPLFIKLPKLQIEGVCFVPEGILLAAETREMLLFESHGPKGP